MASINASAAQTTASKNMPVLKRDSKGRTVAYLQFLLISYGINVGSAGVDGNFATNTENALKQF